MPRNMPQVSPAGQHLLHLMLCPNPRERITVAEVMRHPWFQTELPPPLLTINGHLTQVLPLQREPGCWTDGNANGLCTDFHCCGVRRARWPWLSHFTAKRCFLAAPAMPFPRNERPLLPITLLGRS